MPFVEENLPSNATLKTRRSVDPCRPSYCGTIAECFVPEADNDIRGYCNEIDQGDSMHYNTKAVDAFGDAVCSVC